MKNHRLLSVILNYRTPDLTLAAARALLAETKDLDARLIVVDNASGDGSMARLRDALGDQVGVKLVASPHNGGFGAGNNLGILTGLREYDADLIYVMNSDATPDAGAISALIDALDHHPNAGFAGSYIQGPDGVAHMTAFRFPSIASELEGAARFGPLSRLLKSARVPMDLPVDTRPVDWLAGASIMMRREVLQDIGLFDENFFLYFEETDLCLRAARADWQTLYVRNSSVTHIGSASTGMKTWSRMPTYWFQSRHYYFRKNHGAVYAALAAGAHVLGGIIHRTRAIINRTQSGPRWFLLDFIRFNLGAAFRRPKPQAIPKVPQ